METTLANPDEPENQPDPTPKSDQPGDVVPEGRAIGGHARAEALTPEERKAIARQGAQARWDTSLPRATHEGVLRIGTLEVPCAVLDNGMRVITQSGMMKTLGRSRQAKGRAFYDADVNLPAFLQAKNLKPFIGNDLLVTSSQFEFQRLRGGRAFGYSAELLPKVCAVFIDAERKGALVKRQLKVAETAHVLLRGLATTGIIALVDEATGYQYERARDELSKILEAYINEELRPYIPRFPHSFFQEIYRLHGWDYKPNQIRGPRYVGKLINQLIYDPMPAGVPKRLRAKNPVTESGRRRFKNFQFLTDDIGEPHLDRQIAVVTGLMRASKNKGEFQELFNRVFGHQVQRQLAFEAAGPDVKLIDVEVRPAS